MGDRANIYLRDSENTSGIYLYTHDDAQSWPSRLQEALRFGKSRYNDPSYLSRIIASRVFADLVDSVIGGGLSTELGDNQYPLLCVDLLGRRVGLCDVETSATDDNEPTVDPHDMSTWRYVVSFEEFCELCPVCDRWGWWSTGPDPALN
jgi:hypothetical protein